jgi:nucleoside-diphosphate-sugar epimerase
VVTRSHLEGAPLLVTGATGFLGSAFVRHAVQQGGDVTVIAREAADPWRLAPVSGEYATILASLAELADAPPAPAQALVHFAAAGVNQSFDDVNELVETNVVGTLHALEFARRSEVSRFVLIGSSGEYGTGEGMDEDHALRPTSEYGATRASATLLARAYAHRRGLDVVVVRPFAVYGPYEAPYRLLPYAILQGLRGRPIRISSGIQTRDYIHVDDVAAGVGRAALLDSAADGVFNLCSGINTSVFDAATLTARLTGGRSRVESGAIPTIPGEMWRTSGTSRRARETLGWAPRWGLTEGLTQTIDWFRDGGAQLAPYRDALRDA